MISYDASTALIVVDVQNDFAHPAGALYVPGGEQLVSLINQHSQAAAGAGATLVYTQDWHPAHTPHFAQDGGIWPVHCVAGSWGAEFTQELEVRGDVVRKGTGGEDGYSAFTVRDPVSGAQQSTGLSDTLRDLGVERLVLVGLATDYCVKETALDGVRLGFHTAVVERAVRAVDLEPGDGRCALAQMSDAGVQLVGG